MQLGIEMRPMFAREGIWAYPFYAGVGGTFGYWLKGVEDRQLNILRERREILLEKRRRRDEREKLGGSGETAGVFSATS